MESMVGVVQGVKGKTTDIVYDLFFSDKRVVAAVVLYFSDLADIYKFSVKTMLFGNMLGSREAKVRSLKVMGERREAFKDKSLDEILALHKASMEIDYENVVSVTVRKGLLETTLEFLLRPERKIDFWLDKKQIAEVEGLLAKVLPEKMK